MNGKRIEQALAGIVRRCGGICQKWVSQGLEGSHRGGTAFRSGEGRRCDGISIYLE